MGGLPVSRVLRLGRVETMNKNDLLVIVLLLTAAAGWISCQSRTSRDPGELSKQGPIRVGVLHSLSGTMAISEKSVADAALLAIDEINEAGGLLGQSGTVIAARAVAR